MPSAARTSRWKPYLDIARPDHWVKNVFVIPGIVAGVASGTDRPDRLAVNAVAGLISVCLISSSNYVLNEIVDAPFDRHHPAKRNRPVPSGLVSIPLARAEWVVLMAAGLALGVVVSAEFAIAMAALWVMAVAYNVPPLRTKDQPYLDVLSESINNPIRLIAGWLIAGAAKLPPASLIVSYWMAGAYFMGVKRFAEYREINSRSDSAAYRRSFAYYNEPRLLVSIMFYATFAMLTFGAFMVRYRLELVLATPLVAAVMAIYLKLAFQPNSGVQHPEYLYRESRLMIAVVLCAAALSALMFVDIPMLYRLFSPEYSGLPPAR